MSYGRPAPRIEGMVSLKVDNLTYRTTVEDLRRAFERCGEVGDIYIPRDRFTRESRGFAFVRFYDKRDAEDALDAMDGRMMDGRELRVQMARYGRPSSPQRRNRGRRRSRGRRSRSRSRTRRSVSRSRSRSDSKSSRGRSKSPPSRNGKRRSKSVSKSRSRSRS
ncbi:serine/arginine-rich splicing factor 2 [Leptinotarsa decemlineata]|uniref:serine/arginine-rich splicing factor 2 n=1 Tax=Leptinotarsa decemlineata TaxID=7539 RepID=UPI000C253EBD|nr:serine/arginine-rich splicing factor 2-like [Leptinotarsa decemlineata]